MAINQGDGLGTVDRKATDRTRKVLNYPGLVYFDEKNKQKFIRTINGIGPDANGNVNVEGGTGGGGSTTFNGTYVETVNGESGTVTVTPAKIGAVPTTRTVNGKSLRKNIVLSASDILVSGSGQTVYEALQGFEPSASPYFVITIRPSDWTLKSAGKKNARTTYDPWLERKVTEAEYYEHTGSVFDDDDESGRVDENGVTIYIGDSYSEIWVAHYDISDDVINGQYEYVWCNTGDLPQIDSALAEYYEEYDDKHEYLYVDRGLVRYSEAGQTDLYFRKVSNAYVELGLNVRHTVYQSKEHVEMPNGSSIVINEASWVFDEDNPPVMPDKTIYIVLRRLSDENGPDGEYKYEIERDSAGPTGTPLQNGIDTSNGKSLLVPVWSNESPDSAFPAQTVTCDLSQFSFAAVEYRQWNDGSAHDANQLVIGMIGTDVNMSIVSGFASNNVGRRVATLSPDGVTFSYIGYDAETGSNSTRNKYCVPIRIYGVNVEKKGDKGDQGPAGETGERGDKGETGAKGDPFTFEDFTQEQLDTLTEGIAGAAEGISSITDSEIDTILAS